MDRRVLRTRLALREALLSLMDEKDYNHITVEEITERANMGRTTFYLHYRDKEDLLLDEFADLIHDLTEKVAHMPLAAWQEQNLPQPPILMIFQHVAANEKLYRFITSGQGMSEATQRLCTILEDAVTELAQTKGEVQEVLRHSQAPTNFIANYFAGVLLVTIGWWLKQGWSSQPEEIAKLFQKMFVPGVKKVLGVDSE